MKNNCANLQLSKNRFYIGRKVVLIHWGKFMVSSSTWATHITKQLSHNHQTLKDVIQLRDMGFENQGEWKALATRNAIIQPDGRGNKGVPQSDEQPSECAPLAGQERKEGVVGVVEDGWQLVCCGPSTRDTEGSSLPPTTEPTFWTSLSDPLTSLSTAKPPQQDGVDETRTRVSASPHVLPMTSAPRGQRGDSRGHQSRLLSTWPPRYLYDWTHFMSSPRCSYAKVQYNPPCFGRGNTEQTSVISFCYLHPTFAFAALGDNT